MSGTPNLGLTYLAASQAQKEITHNEALNDLDVLAQGCVESRVLATPPATPVEGAAYIVAASPSGAWAGHANDVAFYFSGWTFKTPKAGWRFYVRAEAEEAVYDGSAWKIRALAASVSWTPGALANGAGISSTAVAVSGAAFGDFVLVAAPYDLQGVLATAYVNASGSAVIRLHNATGGAVTLASGVWKLRIVKA